jgi:hypothetical protein
MAPEVEGFLSSMWEFTQNFPPLKKEKGTVKLLISDFLVWTPPPRDEITIKLFFEIPLLPLLFWTITQINY